MKKVHMKALLFVIILALALTGCSQSTTSSNEVQKFKIGILPTEDALPLIVANQNGYFADENIEVELVKFQSAVESQSAIQSGQLDGMITDLIVTSLLKESGLDLKVTTITLGASPERRRFAIVASPKSGIESIEDLKGKSIGISNNSIIEYITDRLLDSSNIDKEDVNKTAIPKIPVRLEMLVNDQIDAANIPEPLVTFAELQGAKVVLDDTSNDNLSNAVLVLTNSGLEKRTEGFFRAYAKAIKDINADPSKYKETLVNNINIPKPVIQKYEVPTYPELQLPAEKDVNDVIDWLNGKGLIKKDLNYKDLTQSGLY